MPWSFQVSRVFWNAKKEHILISNFARLQLYNMAALCTQDDLETQKYFLQLEHGILQRFYPEEAERQDEEIEPLVKCSSSADGVLNWFGCIKACTSATRKLRRVEVFKD